MKKILITGKNSYIGTSFEKWLLNASEQYQIDTIDMKDKNWRKLDFSQYDVVFHVAAIVHVKERNTKKYFEVNRDLAIEVAQKAKSEGVKQFIFLSTMGVYGKSRGFIDENTEPNPKTPYAKSKLEAEKLLNELATESFVVSILRPPLVYGKGCRGNYTRLSGLAVKIPVFPKVNNKRSMIYIDNLSEFVKLVIDKNLAGLFFPQNAEYVNTSELVQFIAKTHKKRVILTKFFNPILRLLKIDTINKVFGDLVYDLKMSECDESYQTCNFIHSIQVTEGEE